MTPLFDTLISAAELRGLTDSASPPLLLDCSFDLTDAAAGQRAWAAGHLPGALHAHLERDLSGPKTGLNGRHPLPNRRDFAALAGAWGLTRSRQVVVYDGQGATYAARAWWLLRWLGHGAVAVLDGGTAAWRAAGGALVTDSVLPTAQPPYPELPPAMPMIDADALLAGLGRFFVLDARAGERFRGEIEPLDAVAGHIPGARQRFYKDNLQADGSFKPAALLRTEFEALALPTLQLESCVHQCGSGVTACHNLLAMAHAGLAGSALYAGSWSEWCADPARPVARG